MNMLINTSIKWNTSLSAAAASYSGHTILLWLFNCYYSLLLLAEYCTATGIFCLHEKNDQIKDTHTHTHPGTATSTCRKCYGCSGSNTLVCVLPSYYSYPHNYDGKWEIAHTILSLCSSHKTEVSATFIPKCFLSKHMFSDPKTFIRH